MSIRDFSLKIIFVIITVQVIQFEFILVGHKCQKLYFAGVLFRVGFI